MNAVTLIAADFRERAAERDAIRRANIKRMAEAALVFASRPDDELAALQWLDAASHLIETDLSDEVADLARECGVDTEGYPLTDDGDRDYRADRVLVLGEPATVRSAAA